MNFGSKWARTPIFCHPATDTATASRTASRTALISSSVSQHLADEAENHHHFGSSAFISASVRINTKRRQVWQNVTYSYGEPGTFCGRFPRNRPCRRDDRRKVCKYGLIRGIIGSGDGFQTSFTILVLQVCDMGTHSGWLSESSYSATPRFAASRLPWFRNRPHPLNGLRGKTCIFRHPITSFREFSFQDFRDGLANNM